MSAVCTIILIKEVVFFVTKEKGPSGLYQEVDVLVLFLGLLRLANFTLKHKAIMQ